MPRVLGAAALAVMLLAAPPAIRAETFEQGLEAVRAGEPERARDIWTPLAEAGDAAAQYSLAKLYEKGQGAVAQDLEQAVLWYRRAADQGMPAARNNLALMHAQGRGVPIDQRRAAELWRASALQDYPWGQYNLGLAHFRGQGVAADRREAVGWFRRAADGGLAEAQFIMGQLRREGLVLEQDRGQALSWYQMAAKQGHAEAVAQFDALVTTGVKPKPVDAPEFAPLGVTAAKVSDSGYRPGAPDPTPAGGRMTRSPSAENGATAGKPASAADTRATAETPTEDAEAIPRPPRKPKIIAQHETAPDDSAAEAAKPEAENARGMTPDPTNEQIAALPADMTVAPGEAADGLPRVWLASASSRDKAQNLWRDMQARYGEALENVEAIFAPVAVGDETLYRILAGPVAGDGAAEQFCARLRGADANAFCQVRPN